MSHAENFGSRFGRLVRERRGIEGMSLEELAYQAFGENGRKGGLSDLENGKVSNPHQRTVDRLIVALNLSPEDVARCHSPPVPSLPAGFLDEIGLPLDVERALAWQYAVRDTSEDLARYQAYLRSKAEEVRLIQARVAELRGTEWHNILGGLEPAIKSGAFDEADQILAEAEREQEQRGTLPQLQRQERLRMLRGETALLRGDISGACTHFEAAAMLFAAVSRDETIRSRLDANDKLHWHGRKFDSEAIEEAEQFLDRNFRMIKRKSEPELWGRHCSLAGLNLQFIGFRKDGQGGVELLSRALGFYEKALTVFDKVRHLEEWLATRTNQAVANRQLATRLGKNGGLPYAVAAVSAYEEIRACIPAARDLEVARTAANLSTALTENALLTTEAAVARNCFVRAVDAGRDAAAVYERRGISGNLAIAYNNTGRAKVERARAGLSVDAAGDLLDGIGDFERAQQLIPKEVNALGWAELEENIADALVLLVERHGGTNEQHCRASDAYIGARDVFLTNASTFNAEKCARKLAELKLGT